MNALDIHNYGMSLLTMVGISSIPALIAKYDKDIIRVLGDIVLPGKMPHRIVIESDPSRTYHSPMTLEG